MIRCSDDLHKDGDRMHLGQCGLEADQNWATEPHGMLSSTPCPLVHCSRPFITRGHQHAMDEVVHAPNRREGCPPESMRSARGIRVLRVGCMVPYGKSVFLRHTSATRCFGLSDVPISVSTKLGESKLNLVIIVFTPYWTPTGSSSAEDGTILATPF